MMAPRDLAPGWKSRGDAGKTWCMWCPITAWRAFDGSHEICDEGTVVAQSKVRQRPPCDGNGRRRATRKSAAAKRVCSEAQGRPKAPVSFLMKSPMPYATGFTLVSLAIGNRR